MFILWLMYSGGLQWQRFLVSHKGQPVSLIKQEDFIQSIADALQYISYYHPVDYIKNLALAYECEKSPAAKDAMAQILINSRMCAEGRRPICQDTGIVTVFLSIGMDVRWDDVTMDVEEMVNEGFAVPIVIRITRYVRLCLLILPASAAIRGTIRQQSLTSRLFLGAMLK